MTRADSRPRVHIWPLGPAAAWSIGPGGHRSRGETPGQALDQALASLDRRKGVVVILEPAA